MYGAAGFRVFFKYTVTRHIVSVFQRTSVLLGNAFDLAVNRPVDARDFAGNVAYNITDFIVIVVVCGALVVDIFRVVSFYAKGMSVSDIEEQIRETYKFDVSTATISRITSRVTEDIVAWQNRPLEPVYLIVWMDGIVFKVRENSKVVNNCL